MQNASDLKNPNLKIDTTTELEKATRGKCKAVASRLHDIFPKPRNRPTDDERNENKKDRPHFAYQPGNWTKSNLALESQQLFRFHRN